MKLDFFDLKFAYMRMPEVLIKVMKQPEWHKSIFVGGGFIRSIVAGEPINDVDVFVKSEKDAELLSLKLCRDKSDIYKTDNAYTIKGKLPIQIIHRWVFNKPEDVGNSFDFTICNAVIYFDGENFDSYCDNRFYIDLAAKRIVYRNPVRNEDAGGSMLRVLKYYQKGYRIPLNSLGDVIARLLKGVRWEEFDHFNEQRIGEIITGLLREVDPDIDPTHASHLPSNIEI
jgi:hypothetical protein